MLPLCRVVQPAVYLAPTQSEAVAKLFILVIPDFILVIPDFILVIPDFILVIPDFILVIPDFILVIPDFILVIPDFILVIPDLILVIPDLILVIPAKAGIHTDSPQEPFCPVPPLALSSPRRQRSTVGAGFPPSRE
ncbi:hypothetical protein [Endozoicomonas sp. 8E]|uniref:hypothetical protein n=1 Tax=Endozoicomonas sp. 8E TaxID=3035692 RepID=UPI00293947C2|nr:hypothetical protein [Endozoicomonas sp. 8E]WOG28861.1 hypothetical protein P6910_04145 [Endozoicomonas sp. 8E]